MLRRAICVVFVVLLAASVGALAADSKGRWGNHQTSSMEIPLPDGRTAVIMHYTEIFHGEDPNDPLYDAGADCSGKMIMKGDKTLSGSGVCFTSDSDGDGIAMWWRVTESGTPTCADLCGTWGIYDGYGKFKGTKGEGTWKRTSMRGDGDSGTWKGTYSR